MSSHVFKETQFVAVTAYQNDKVRNIIGTHYSHVVESMHVAVHALLSHSPFDSMQLAI